MYALPQRDFSYYVHMIDLRKMQRAGYGCGYHYLLRTGINHLC